MERFIILPLAVIVILAFSACQQRPAETAPVDSETSAATLTIGEAEEGEEATTSATLTIEGDGEAAADDETATSSASLTIEGDGMMEDEDGEAMEE